jgi:hypothetical protein
MIKLKRNNNIIKKKKKKNKQVLFALEDEATDRRIDSSKREKNKTQKTEESLRHCRSGAGRRRSASAPPVLGRVGKPEVTLEASVSQRTTKCFENFSTLNTKRSCSYSPPKYQDNARPSTIRSAKLKNFVSIRQLEMTRERLLVQQRDRNTRKLCLLSKQEKNQGESSRRNLNEALSSPAQLSMTPEIRQESKQNKKKMTDPIDMKKMVTDKTLSSTSKRAEKDQPHAKAGKENWLPPRLNSTELEIVKNVTVPVITTAQQTATKDWLLSLGISILDGEGGFYLKNHKDRSGIPPLPLSRDRLRNGELFCVLYCLLEPSSSCQANLFGVIHRSPRTFCHAIENLEKGLWLFRLSSSPPIPAVYLLQPEEFVKCNVNFIWGLLWEIYQCYLFRTQSINPLPSSSLSSLFQLTYNQIQRRSLDVSIVEWLNQIGILKRIVGTSVSSSFVTAPTTTLSLEPSLKDGTLFCLLTEFILRSPIKGSFYFQPHSYTQCLSNVSKMVELLRSCKALPRRFLYSGVEEEIVRGSWDAILGLLEDLHFFHDTVKQFVGSPSNYSEPKPCIKSLPPAIPFDNIPRPYLGPKSLRKNRRTSVASSDLKHSEANKTFEESVSEDIPQQQQETVPKLSSLPRYALLRNLVRLEKFYPTNNESNGEKDGNAENVFQPMSNGNGATVFKPSLDIRESFQGYLE